jgi:hypothetical protein
MLQVPNLTLLLIHSARGEWKELCIKIAYLQRYWRFGDEPPSSLHRKALAKKIINF